jgi:hypothetical protein
VRSVKTSCLLCSVSDASGRPGNCRKFHVDCPLMPQFSNSRVLRPNSRV